MSPTTDDRSEFALIREFVKPIFPGDRKYDQKSKPPEPAAERLRALFDRDAWTPEEAMWLFALGEVAPSATTAAFKQVRRALSRSDGWADLPDGLALVVDMARERRKVLRLKRWPAFRHEWIRFAVQSRLLVSLEFWAAYGDWKAHRWADGYEMAYLVEAPDPTSGDKDRYLFRPIPAEATWTLPYGYEDAVVDAEVDGRMHFKFGRRGRPLEELIRAVKDSRATIMSRRDPRAPELLTIGRVGAENVARIGEAVRCLAKSRGVDSDPTTGLYQFKGLLIPDLIALLRELDPQLEQISEDRMRHTLPRYVKGTRGRRPKSEGGEAR